MEKFRKTWTLWKARMGRLRRQLGAVLNRLSRLTRAPRVSLVEDNVDSQTILARMLHPRYETKIYSSGMEALVGLKLAPPDVVLLDICLPDMNGFQVLKRLRQDKELRTIPVIAVTAYAVVGDREDFIQMGFDGYASKPIRHPSHLTDLIDGVLNRRWNQHV